MTNWINGALHAGQSAAGETAPAEMLPDEALHEDALYVRAGRRVQPSVGRVDPAVIDLTDGVSALRAAASTRQIGPRPPPRRRCRTLARCGVHGGERGRTLAAPRSGSSSWSSLRPETVVSFLAYVLQRSHVL
jgi:hypothetical protein